jgi:hypothetical protein
MEGWLERIPRGGTYSVKEDPIYKEHRIHTTPLLSGRWISAIVNFGKKKVVTKDSLTDTVTRVPGEYDSEEQALRAAREYISTGADQS